MSNSFQSQMLFKIKCFTGFDKSQPYGLYLKYPILTAEKRQTICGIRLPTAPGGCIDRLQLNMPMVCLIVAGLKNMQEYFTTVLNNQIA
jgi:hypothetical protein